MNESLFQKNVEKWTEVNPKKALLLPYLALKKTKAVKETAGSLNQWFSSLDLGDTEVLFVYGVGGGLSYLAAKNWLKNGRRLIFLEDDLEVIYRLFLTDVGEKLLHDPQVSLYYFQDLSEIKEITLALRWEFLMKKIKVEASSLYKKTKGEMYDNLFHRIENDQSLHNSLVSEYLEYGAAFFKNFYENMLLLPGSYQGSGLFGKFKNVPAIICGAGPSLNQHLPLLKDMQNKALIFAGGSSFNALTAHGITPHFGAGIDPNAPQVERIKETCHVKVPFFFRNRIHHDALKLIKGPKLYIPGSGGYDISEWFENELNINRERILDEGHNVINFEVEIAHAMGCSPIILVGMDLAYTGMRSYAEGIVKQPEVTKKEILKEEMQPHELGFDLKAILKKDIYGKPIYTLWKWIVESEWMGDFVKEHKKAVLINATEGGIGFPGVPNMSFKAVQKRYLNKNYRLKKRINDLIEKNFMPQVTKKKIKGLMKELQESLVTCSSCLTGLLEEVEAIQGKIKLLKKLEPGAQIVSGRAALLESDLFEEVAYKYILDVFSEAFSGVLNHEMRAIRLSGDSEKKKALKKLDLNVRRLAFLKTVAEVNLAILKM